MENGFPTRDIYTVTRLNQEARSLMEANFPAIWIEGEISNLARPRSGHVYFSLKDEKCQIRCAMFRMHHRHSGFTLEDGARVLARARASLYPQRGDFQLIVEYLEEIGEGALRQAFEVLKRQLAAQGLFASSCKKPLPPIPKQIGVITSPSGAAIRDILAVLKRRFPGVPVLLYPASVQGREAIPEIARMLDLAGERRECDVLILARGGGSLEDLWAFNEERVARAIYRCGIPIVSAIGHEIDFTIADFVADSRAPTPSAAAELVVPDQREWQRKIAVSNHRALSLTHRHLAQKRREILWLQQRLVHPRRRLSDDMQRVDDLMARLHRCEPSAKIRAYAARRQQLAGRSMLSIERSLAMHGAHLASLQRALDAMNPQRTLDRGYAIITKPPGNEIAREAKSMMEGDRIHARLAKGAVLCTVFRIEEEASERNERPYRV